QQMGGLDHETLHPVAPATLSKGRSGADLLREAAHKKDIDGAERVFASLAQGSLDDAYNDLLVLVQENVNVHRVVLAWRSWALLDLTGKEHAHTMLRQSVRFCCDEEKAIQRNGGVNPLVALLPQLLDRYKLLGRAAGTRQPDDAWIEQLAQ